jgi:hypothetical protein
MIPLGLMQNGTFCPKTSASVLTYQQVRSAPMLSFRANCTILQKPYTAKNWGTIARHLLIKYGLVSRLRLYKRYLYGALTE